MIKRNVWNSGYAGNKHADICFQKAQIVRCSKEQGLGAS
jgi:hypothetical protein